MRYWWVNQNQTFQQETAGGYLWSPKLKKGGVRNPFYEFMREVSPGDLVLSFEGTYIRAIGVIQSHCYECPKPPEFGSAGPTWDLIGWKVDVHYHVLRHQVRPADHMQILVPHMAEKYAPLQSNGRGMQGVYLTSVSSDFMEAMAGLIGTEATNLLRMTGMAEPVGSYGQGLVEWEEHLRDEISARTDLSETEKQQLILARRGQGQFRKNVQRLEQRCRVTRVDQPEHLRASHCKPWRDCQSAEERLDGENGLLLTPSIDHLFDRGFISFENNGRLLVSPVAHRASLARMGVPVDEALNVGAFSEGQRQFLEFHRNHVLLAARVGRV